MNFILTPSLEHIAFVKVAVLLWNQENIKTLVKEFSNSPLFLHVEGHSLIPPLCIGRRENWQEIEKKVIEKVEQLEIPACSKQKILGYIEAVGLQILKWMEYHRKNCSFDLNLPNEFCWTPQGTIDKKRTTKMIIKDESIDIATRYKLACIYCLEDDIPELWNKILEKDRKSFYSEEGPSKVLQQELVVFWTYFIKGEMAKLEHEIRRRLGRRGNFYLYQLQCAAVSGNKVATEYFLQKLRKKALIKTASCVARTRRNCYRKRTNFPKIYYVEVLCFLLSQMNSEEQVEVFKSCPFDVLICFLDWPWQNLFFEIGSRVWDFFPEGFYSILLSVIIHKVLANFKDCNYQKMFGEVWQQIPSTHKSYVLNTSIDSLLEMLLSIKDNENIKLIFQDITLIDKKELIFSKKGQSICESMVYCDEWDLLKIFVQMCISSKDEMMKFKEQFVQHVQSFEKCYYAMIEAPEIEKYLLSKDRLNLFFQLLEDIVCKFDKRKNVDDNDCSESKKFCTNGYKDSTLDEK